MGHAESNSILNAPMAPALRPLPAIPLLSAPTPIEELSRLRATLGGGPRLLVKRDDTIGFAFGGNKVRKMALVAADARARGADTLITCGGVQSNHARVTAAAAAKLGLHCILVVNGARPAKPSANALLDGLLGADVRYVPARDARAAAMEEAAEELRRSGRTPYVVPLGASTPLGAAGYVKALFELIDQIPPPDIIVHASSSGGTQAGLVAGCALADVPTRVIGVSADESSAALEQEIRRILAGLPQLLECDDAILRAADVTVDDRFVGEGYGIPTPLS